MNRHIRKRMNNKGAAMVMVIIVIAFVSILTTVLLYLATMNYHMKSTDFKTKDAFYTSEIPLEGIRTLLVMDVAEAAAAAYDESIVTYANTDEATRDASFQDTFYDYILEKWEEKCHKVPSDDTTKWDWIHGMNNYGMSQVIVKDICHVVSSTSWNDTTGACGDSDCDKAYHVILDNTIAKDQRLKRETVTEAGVDVTKLMLYGIKVVYVENEFASIIETNYCIVAPDINWSINESTDGDNGGNIISREDIDFESLVTYQSYKKQ